MQKLPGVETVEVSLTKASTDIRFRPGNTVTLAQLREVIKNGGFKSGTIQITATAKLVRDNSRVTSDLAPSKVTLIVESDPANPSGYAEARKLADSAPGIVEITGTIEQGGVLLVKSVTRKQGLAR